MRIYSRACPPVYISLDVLLAVQSQQVDGAKNHLIIHLLRFRQEPLFINNLKG